MVECTVECTVECISVLTIAPLATTKCYNGGVKAEDSYDKYITTAVGLWQEYIIILV